MWYLLLRFRYLYTLQLISLPRLEPRPLDADNLVRDLATALDLVT